MRHQPAPGAVGGRLALGCFGRDFCFNGSVTRTLFLLTLLLLLAAPSLGADLQRLEHVRLIPTDWADGDSFRVRAPDGEQHTLRLYGADCIEWHVTDETDARRLRAQRRYFGVSAHGGGPQSSITLATEHGALAGDAVAELLEQPFTVYTTFADGRGDARYQRIYAFVETADGKDLATELVRRGLARAYGVYRTTADGRSRDDYREQLKDAELVAAQAGAGIWAYTDWQALPQERQAQRREEAEDDIALGKAEPTEAIDLNTATRGELMSIRGIGEVTANRIIASRPYAHVDDLLRVNGIGPATLAKLKPYVRVE